MVDPNITFAKFFDNFYKSVARRDHQDCFSVLVFKIDVCVDSKKQIDAILIIFDFCGRRAALYRSEKAIVEEFWAELQLLTLVLLN